MFCCVSERIFATFVQHEPTHPNIMSQLFNELVKTAHSLHPNLVELRHDLHQHPELSWAEVRTSSKIMELLQNEGLSVRDNLAGTGFYTEIIGEMPTTADVNVVKTVAYRADMDALPIQDNKRTDYCSKNPGIGHMCGHDYHTTVSFGVAQLLNHNKDKFAGTVRVFWQPAEETTPSGAPTMIKDGVLKDVDAVFGIHCDPTFASGKVGLTVGPDTASYDAFEIEVLTESTTHSARPHTGKDTIWIAHQMVQNMYQLATRITDARSPLVVSICKFEAGSALNVMPDRTYFGGTIRASSITSRQIVRDQVNKMAHHFEELYGVTIKVSMLDGAPPVINNAELYEISARLVREALGEDRFLKREQSMGAEDFAYYSQLVPSLFMRVGTSNGPDTSHALHTRLFDLDESTIGPTVALQAYLLINHLGKKRISLT